MKFFRKSQKESANSYGEDRKQFGGGGRGRWWLLEMKAVNYLVGVIACLGPCLLGLFVGWLASNCRVFLKYCEGL